MEIGGAKTLEIGIACLTYHHAEAQPLGLDKEFTLDSYSKISLMNYFSPIWEGSQTWFLDHKGAPPQKAHSENQQLYQAKGMAQESELVQRPTEQVLSLSLRVKMQVWTGPGWSQKQGQIWAISSDSVRSKGNIQLTGLSRKRRAAELKFN